MKKNNNKHRPHLSSFLPTILLVFLAFEVALVLRGPLSIWENAYSDLMMRWRRHLKSNSSSIAHPDVTFLAIDAVTQDKLGRFGSGDWQTRSPFFMQLAFFRSYATPSVLAYDIVIEDPLGQLGRKKERVTESEILIRQIISELNHVIKSPGLMINPVVLDGLNRLSLEQANDRLAHALALYWAKTKTRPVLGCYFRGGVFGGGYVTEWTERDIIGNSDEGDEDSGERIPYLKDLAIPDESVEMADSSVYRFAVNAKLPAQELLDYCHLGAANGGPDADGVYRRVPLVAGFTYRNPVSNQKKQVMVPTLSLLSSLLHLGVVPPFKPEQIKVRLGSYITVRPPEKPKMRIPIDKEGRMLLNYNASLSDFNTINFFASAPPENLNKEIAENHASKIRQYLEGKLVVVGVASAGIDDGVTPLVSSTPLVAVHLTAIDNILSGRMLTPLSERAKTLIMLGLCILFAVIATLEKTARIGPAAMLFLALYLALVFTLLMADIAVLPAVKPVVMVLSGTLMLLTYRFFVEERARRKIRGMFSTMVSDRVLAYLEENPGSFSLRGHQVEATMMFVDIDGFTSISEPLEPQRLTLLLNQFFTPITNNILDNGGYLDKYIGDGIMAVWGAPFPDPDHAGKTCASALEQIALLRSLNPQLKNQFGVELNTRVGINSGLVAAGNMGSDKKFQYTVMGDAVNFAARLEPINKDFGTRIIIGENTNSLIKTSFLTRRLSRIRVFGKSESAVVYELMAHKNNAGEDLVKLAFRYELALEEFWHRRWDECLRILSEDGLADTDKASSFLAKQAALFKIEPPDTNWNGEYIRQSKS